MTGTWVGMRRFLLLSLCCTACFVPPTEGRPLPVPEMPAPVTPVPPAVDAGTTPTPIVPPAPITTVVDALAMNPPAIATETSEMSIDGGCRGNAFLAGARRSAACGTGACLQVVGRDGSVRVVDQGEGTSFWPAGADARRLAWVRGDSRRRSLLVAEGASAPRVVTTFSEGLTEVRFDGDDVLVVRSVSSGASARTSVWRYPAGQPESAGQQLFEAPGSIQFGRAAQVQVDASSGRLWLLTTAGLFRSAPRGQVGGGPVPIVNGPRGGTVSAFALTGQGLALVAVDNEVWLSDGTMMRLDHLASLPAQSSIGALAPFGTGFAAVANSSVFVLDGAGPIRRILGRSDVSAYGTTEEAIAVSGRRIFVNTLCLSWSSYPGYDTAVLEPDAAQPTARWWWNVYASQHDLPVIPKARVNVGGNTLSSVELIRGPDGFVTTSL